VELQMDRETIAYLLIVILAVAMIATLVFAYQNTPKRKYKRSMKRQYAARREQPTKLQGK
jgi:cbb3-type cytochrome oxidase subunit 3